MKPKYDKTVAGFLCSFASVKISRENVLSVMGKKTGLNSQVLNTDEKKRFHETIFSR